MHKCGCGKLFTSMPSNKFVAGNILIDAEEKPDYETRTSVYLLSNVVTVIFPHCWHPFCFSHRSVFSWKLWSAVQVVLQYEACSIAIIWGFPAHQLIKHTCATLGWLLPLISATVNPHLCNLSHPWTTSVQRKQSGAQRFPQQRLLFQLVSKGIFPTFGPLRVEQLLSGILRSFHFQFLTSSIRSKKRKMMQLAA